MNFRVNIKYVLNYLFGGYLYRRGIDRATDKPIVSARELFNKKGFHLDGSPSIGLGALIRLVKFLYHGRGYELPKLELSLVFENFEIPKFASQDPKEEAQHLSDLVVFDIIETPIELLREIETLQDGINAELEYQEYTQRLEARVETLEKEIAKLKSQLQCK